MARITGNLKAWALGAAAAAVLAAACATGGGGGGAPPAAAGKWPTTADVVPAAAESFTPAGLAALDARMKEAVDKSQVAGLEYVLIKDGKVVAFKVYGNQSFGGPPMAENTIFRIRSMTKPVVGVAMMQLWEQGKWKPEDPITKFLPELASLKVATKADSITEGVVPVTRPPNMNEVMTHTAGFGYGLSAATAVDREFQRDNPHAQPNLQAAMNRLKDIPLLAQPGERWSYSYTVDVQSAALEKMSGMTLGNYLDKNIFTPLAMNDTGFFLDEKDRGRFATVYTRAAPAAGGAGLDGAPGQSRAAPKPGEGWDVFPDGYSFYIRNHHESGGGGLTSTTHDYARFVQMIINEGTLDGKQILKPETVRYMMQNHIGDKRAMGGGGFGYGGSVVTTEPNDRQPQPKGTFAWFGIDGTWFWVDPVNKIGFVGMIQRRGGAGQGGIDVRAESARLVYAALKK